MDTNNEPMLQYFEYSHLPPKMQAISMPFGELAKLMVDQLPRNPERTVMLRKLLEAKDCAVRASIYKDPTTARPPGPPEPPAPPPGNKVG
jgi:hypothetical protein